MLYRAAAALLLLAATSAAQQTITLTAEDGAKIVADEYGKGRRGVVLAHGGRFTRKSWADQARRFADAGYHCVAIDFRGFGESHGPGETDMYSAPLYLDVLAAVRYLKTTGATSLSLIGGSFGASSAADAAIRARPGEIDRIVLLAGEPNDDPSKLPGRKLFVIARDDSNGAGPRVPSFQAAYDKTPGPKKLIVLDGDAHAQFLFQSPNADRVMKEILAFLSAK
jgi:pimeloyl-ACP methyl ester carboxylesterase